MKERGEEKGLTASARFLVKSQIGTAGGRER